MAAVHSGQGRPFGASRQVPFDRWFRYAAGFASDYAALLFSELQLPVGSRVVDPFSGVGISGTAARIRGLRFFGIEAHPMMAELANAKLTWPRGGLSLLEAGELIIDEAKRLASEPAFDAEPDLVRRSFSPAVLAGLISLRQSICTVTDTPWHTHMKWALLGTLRECANVRVGWPYQRPAVNRLAPFNDPIARFRIRLSQFHSDIATVPGDRLSTGRVIHGDSCLSASWSRMRTRGQGCLTSPPYLNNFDYADASRLEAYFWGTAKTWGELCNVVRGQMLTASTQQSSVGEAERARTELSSYPEITQQVDPLLKQLSLARQCRPRGKEYDQVLAPYVLAMLAVFRRMYSHLDSGAPVAILVGDSAPYGVYVDTPSLIAVAAAQVGYVPISDRIVRRRGMRWASNTVRHKVPLSERLLLLRRI